MKTLNLHIMLIVGKTQEALPTKEKKRAKGDNPAQEATVRQLPLPFKKKVGCGQPLNPVSAKAARTG